MKLGADIATAGANVAPAVDEPHEQAGVQPGGSLALFALAGATAALFVANLYYAQPLLTVIARDLKIPPEYAGTIASASQLGYGLGLFLLVPLADLIENKRLVMICSLCGISGMLGTAFAPSAWAFLCAALVIGVFSSGAQVLIPYLSYFIPGPRRGRVLSAIMAGILTSVMLARPFALYVAAELGWRAVYGISAGCSAILFTMLWRFMPERSPGDGVGYRRIVRSMFVVFAKERPVRRRALYQALSFASFTMLWSAIPMMLADHFGLSRASIALFALVGAGGVVAAPLGGLLADRGWVRMGTMGAGLVMASAFLASWGCFRGMSLVGLAAASFLIDGCVQASQMLSRIVVLDVDPAIRSRINGLYMTCVYVSGAFGSTLGALLYLKFGWPAVAFCGAAGGVVVALILFLEME